VSANATRRCLTETGPAAQKVATTTNVACTTTDGVWGDADWAATQTVHLAASVASECLCAANAMADQKVSKRHTNAMLLEIDRNSVTPIYALNLYQNKKRTQRAHLADDSPRLRAGKSSCTFYEPS
jgi:hypothetical protein